MASSTTSNVYIHVIEDVVNKVRDEFVKNGGPGEDVLNELQGLWEIKMMQAGSILAPTNRSAVQRGGVGAPVTPNTVHDLNVPYEGPEEYETPTADLLFPPTPLPGTAQTPLPGLVQTPLPGSENGSLYNISNGSTPITPGEYVPTNENLGNAEIKKGPGRPSQYMLPPSSWLNQRPPLDVNVAYVEGREESERGALNHSATQDVFMNSGKRKRDEIFSHHRAGGYIPQQDGAGDFSRDEMKSVRRHVQPYLDGASSRLPQLDGPVPDPYDDALSTPNIYNYQGAVIDDYNTMSTPVPNEMQAATPALIQNDPVDEGDEPLNEDDDDDSDDGEQGEDLSTTHLILAQFDKASLIQVTRTKSRWKCTLKDAIMHINNKDILFNKAAGEFDF